MLREGDTLSLSAGYSLQIGDYQSIKPHATVTRQLSANVDGDVEDMEAELEIAFKRSAYACLVGVIGFAEKMDAVNGDVELLAQAISEELGHVRYQVEEGRQEEGDTPHKKAPIKKAPIKKGPAKKAAKKKKV